MPRELSVCVERANLDPEVHVIALAGNGKGFCGGYDLVASAEVNVAPTEADRAAAPPGSPLDPMVIARTTSRRPWDPVVDWQMMSRNLRGFMSLFHSDKPVVCKVHGFCVAGRHRPRALLRPARDRGRRPHRLPARPRLGRADAPRSGRSASATSAPSGFSSRAT